MFDTAPARRGQWGSLFGITVTLVEQRVSEARAPNGLWTFVDHRFRVVLDGEQATAFEIPIRITAEHATAGECSAEQAHFEASAWAELCSVAQGIAALADRSPDALVMPKPPGMRHGARHARGA